MCSPDLALLTRSVLPSRCAMCLRRAGAWGVFALLGRTSGEESLYFILGELSGCSDWFSETLLKFYAGERERAE